MRRIAGTLVRVLVFLLFLACGTGAPTTAPSPTPDEIPTFPPGIVGASCDPQEGGDQDAAMLLTDVRVAAQPGHDRVVLEFRPQEGQAELVPFWRVEPADPPLTEDPSGRPLEVSGDAFLRAVVWASGVEFTPDGFNEIYTGPGSFEPEDTAVIAHVREAGDFENVITWLVGLTDEACFKVTELTDPVRIVLDVEAPQDAGSPEPFLTP